jgi:hypothetical protein
MMSPEPHLDQSGAPSLLEKALQYIETDGVEAEGILRKSADVEQVMNRLEAFYQGRLCTLRFFPFHLDMIS